MEELLPFLIGHFDQPFADSSMIPTYHVSKMAREHVTVALSGEGGDELFAGYTWHKKFMFVQNVWKKLPHSLRASILPHILPDSTVPSLFSNQLLHTLFKMSIANRLSLETVSEGYQSLTTSFSSNFKTLVFSPEFKSELGNFGQTEGIGEASMAFASSNSSSLLGRALSSDLNVYLPGDLLTKVDRMSMANSLEVRSPLLDYRLIELAARIPSDFKLRGNISKYILRKAMDPVLPTAIKQRKTKRGFSVPVSQWLRKDLQEYSRSILLDSSLQRHGFFDSKEVESILGMHHDGRRDYGPQIWSLLMFALWAKKKL
jgi:asparagine synthase (glutamine-hydrolysing)